MTMKMITLKCAECGVLFERYTKEIDRQHRNGRDTFFCSLSCGAIHHNRSRKLPRINVICEYCGEEFETSSGCKQARFCSRSCASAGSVTDYRRAKQRESGLKTNNLAKNIGKGLRKREWWKYVDIDSFLDEHGVNHIFEWQTMDRVFDLKLNDYNLLIEFDGPYHKDDRQRALDNEKDRVAKDLGYGIIRVETESASVIPVEVIEKILLDEQII